MSNFCLCRHPFCSREWKTIPQLLDLIKVPVSGFFILSLPSSSPLFLDICVTCTRAAPHVAFHPTAPHGRAAGQKGGTHARLKPAESEPAELPRRSAGSYTESSANQLTGRAEGRGPGGTVRAQTTCQPQWVPEGGASPRGWVPPVHTDVEENLK